MATGVDAKLLKSTKFPPIFNQKVDMQKVNLQVMKKWIAGRISDILGNDDDVVIELCYNLIESVRNPDIKSLQIQLTGFLESQTAEFCKELWALLLSAQTNPQGIPRELLEAKKLELIQEKIEAEKAAEEAHQGTRGEAAVTKDVEATTAVAEAGPLEEMMAPASLADRGGARQNAHAHRQAEAGIFEAEESAEVSVPTSMISMLHPTGAATAAADAASTDVGVLHHDPRILVHGHVRQRGGPALHDPALDPDNGLGHARGRLPEETSAPDPLSTVGAATAGVPDADRFLPAGLPLQNGADTRLRGALCTTEDGARLGLCRPVARPDSHKVTTTEVEIAGGEVAEVVAEAPAGVGAEAQAETGEGAEVCRSMRMTLED
ncbi:hypothetical protein SEPCBS119000_006570 [Sporothrix epigloea]|uniref:PWI domain-containing protein n=1 Tax=Sporothrix epigloea TaxID=1892477 RepID=A0ABP0E7W5_9PEZI